MQYKLGSFVKLPTKKHRIGLVMCHSMGQNCIREIGKDGNFKDYKSKVEDDCGEYYSGWPCSWGEPEYIPFTEVKLNPKVWYELAHEQVIHRNKVTHDHREYLVSKGSLERGKFVDSADFDNYGEDCSMMKLVGDNAEYFHHKHDFLITVNQQYEVIGYWEWTQRILSSNSRILDEVITRLEQL